MGGFLTLLPWISWPKALKILRAVILSFSVSKASKETCCPPASPASVGLGFFSLCISHSFKAASSAYCHLYPSSFAVCQRMVLTLMHAPPHCAFVGTGVVQGCFGQSVVDRLNRTHKRFGSVRKIQIGVFEWVKLPKWCFPYLWIRKRFMLLITTLNFYI